MAKIIKARDGRRPKSEHASEHALWYKDVLSSSGDGDWIPGVRDEYRRRFLHRAATIAPELLASLRFVDPADTAALSTWAERWHLTDTWCLVLARQTLGHWRTHPDATTWEFVGDDDKPHLTVVAMHLPAAIPDFPGLTFPIWNPTWLTRAAYKERIHKMTEHAAELYCNDVDDIMRADGWRPATRKQDDAHFEWLARYVVLREDYEKIASTTSGTTRLITPDGVKKAVQRAARLIGLRVKDGLGRPIGSKDKETDRRRNRVR